MVRDWLQSMAPAEAAPAVDPGPAAASAGPVAAVSTVPSLRPGEAEKDSPHIEDETEIAARTPGEPALSIFNSFSALVFRL